MRTDRVTELRAGDLIGTRVLLPIEMVIFWLADMHRKQFRLLSPSVRTRHFEKPSTDWLSPNIFRQLSPEKMLLDPDLTLFHFLSQREFLESVS